MALTANHRGQSVVAAAMSRLRQPPYRGQNPATDASSEGDGQRAVPVNTAGLVLNCVSYGSPYAPLVSGGSRPGWWSPGSWHRRSLWAEGPLQGRAIRHSSGRNTQRSTFWPGTYQSREEPFGSPKIRREGAPVS